MNNTGFIFRGKNTREVLKELWEEINKTGEVYLGQRGLTKSLKGVNLIIENPSDEKNNYPYWDKRDDDWYQDNFVRKETNSPPEATPIVIPARRYEIASPLGGEAGIQKKVDSGSGESGMTGEGLEDDNYIFPYKYAWRSRYYDLGYGYLKAVVTALERVQAFGSEAQARRGSGFRVQNEKQLVGLLLKTYKLIHPEVLLAVLAWKGEELINFYLKNPSVLDQELESNRTDTLLSIIQELKNSPNSRRAIIPSFTYPQIDQAGPASGVPVYQTYQLLINFNKKGKPKSLTSFHLHRSFDANGGLQLDINHDKDWGLIASKQLKLPLEKIVIYGNDVGIYLNSDSEHISQKTNIKDWLLSVTDAYDPKTEDIEKRLSKEIYKKKIDYTLKKF